MAEHCAQFRFYEELNDFLRPERRKTTLEYAFDGHPGVKDSIEALGVPHTEVDLILVNGRSVGFDYRLQGGDRVAVYPRFESFDISPVQKLRDAPLRAPAFVLDVHLGKLAALLRLLGFDAAYRTDCDDPELVRISLAERRAILTRDRRLLFRKAITHGYFVRSDDPMEQAREVLDRFDLRRLVRPFLRCLACNGLVTPVAKEAVLDRLQPLTRLHYERFSQCGQCGRVYWEGSHHARLAERVARLV